MAIPQLRDKRIFITGSASGIGAAAASAFAAQGCELLLADLDIERLTATDALVRKAGARAHCFALDVSDANQFTAVAREVSERVGVPHVLINNAGIGRTVRSLIRQWMRCARSSMSICTVFTMAATPFCR